MGQKANPVANRLSLTKNWQGKWFAMGKDYAPRIIEDEKIRRLIFETVGPQAMIGRIEIERSIGDLKVAIFTGRPGVIIGRAGKSLQILREKLTKILEGKFKLDVIEIKKSDLDAQIISDNIGIQISKRLPYRRAVKQSIGRVMDAGAKGIKICISGRLGGAEIARREKFNEGSVPLSTFRKNISFGVTHAKTTFGVVGVKVWINTPEENV